MKTFPHTPPRQGEPWTRDQLIEILGVASTVNEFGFIRKTSLTWLAAFPGDLPVQLIHAQAVVKDLNPQQAVTLVKNICQVDPLYAEAQQFKFEVYQAIGSHEENYGELYSLAPKQRIFRDKEIKNNLPDWAEPLAKIRQHLADEDLTGASNFLPSLLGSNPDSP